jgi:antitoxin (DNA-binding transcriptional repressor) of toxin-antitoxin stability system
VQTVGACEACWALAQGHLLHVLMRLQAGQQVQLTQRGRTNVAQLQADTTAAHKV